MRTVATVAYCGVVTGEIDSVPLDDDVQIEVLPSEKQVPNKTSDNESLHMYPVRNLPEIFQRIEKPRLKVSPS